MPKKTLRTDAKALAEAYVDAVNASNIIRLVLDQPSKELAAGMALEIYVCLRAMGKNDDANAFQHAIYNRAITS